MKHIELELHGVAVRAQLLEERAPRTCGVLWEALPLEVPAVHTIWSGNLIHTLEPVPLAVETLESEVAFQYPGLVMYSPKRRELAVCYADARYRDSGGPEYVTPVAEIVGELGPFIKAAARLQFEGAAPLRVRRASAAAAEPEPPLDGTRVEIEVDGAVITAVLLEDSAPRTSAAFKALLPLEGPLTNTKWSGAMAHFWGQDRPARGPIGLEVRPQENPTPFHWPGYIYYHPDYSGIRICYGDGQQSGAFSVSHLTPLARFEGDWSAFRDTATRLQVTGARPMRIRLKP